MLRPNREKDIWDLKRMGVSTNLSQSNAKLSFLVIKQEWLRTAVKSYLSYCLPLYSAGTCRTRVQSIACFSNFLETQKPPGDGKVHHSHNASRISDLSPRQGKHGDQQEPRTQSAELP